MDDIDHAQLGGQQGRVRGGGRFVAVASSRSYIQSRRRGQQRIGFVGHHFDRSFRLAGPRNCRDRECYRSDIEFAGRFWQPDSKWYFQPDDRLSFRPGDRRGSATAVDNAINSETDFGDASSLGADTTLGITLARQNDGRWWNSSTPVLAAGEASSADSETSLISRGLIGNLDTLFGSDIDWADMPARTAGGESSALAATESTGAVAGGGDSEQPSATMLAVGLAISALWSESDRVKQSAEPRQPPLRRRRSSP